LNNNIKQLLGITRPPFLTLALSCVVLGIASATWSGGNPNVTQIVLVFIGGLAAHISVNAFNEYYDFKSGLDNRTRRTPFSGGSGTLPKNPGLARSALAIALTTLMITGLVGLYFLLIRSWLLLPLGLLGLLIVWAYTPLMTRSPILCLLAPGLGFGTFMVMGTFFSLTGEYTWTAFIASLVPFFLVSDLLLLNQFPDVEADQSIGRKHYPITMGKKSSSLIYGLFLLLAYLSIIVGVILGFLPVACLLGLLTIFLAVPAFLSAHRYYDRMDKLVPAMGFNVLINNLTPVLLAIGFWIG
jgi:1,4-dihydroxy-2-naphthoate octaprenyltransferase